mgnify:CR=1 FL=1
MVRIFLLSVPLFLVIGFAFAHFYTRIERLLDDEKLSQYQTQAVEYASSLSYELRHDASNLQILGSTLAHHTRAESRLVLESFKNPLLTLTVVDQATYDQALLFEKEEPYVVHRAKTRLESGELSLLELRIYADAYYRLLGEDLLQSEQSLLWLDANHSMLWYYERAEMKQTLPINLRDLPLDHPEFQTLRDGRAYISIIPLENGYGVLVLVHEARLLEHIYLTVLQSSVSLAVLVVLILLLLLFYLLYKDHQYEKSLLYLAYVDELTRLPNKNHFLTTSAQILQRGRNSYAVIVLDIRKFKLINDHFGYSFGDSLLMHCAKVLSRYTTKDGLCARLSGDKFILLLEYRSKEVLQQRIEAMLDEVRRFSFPGSSPFQLDIALGISFLERKQSLIANAIDNALFALSAIKERQGSGYVYYEEALKEQLLEESELEKVFHAARKAGEFFVMLQPKYSLHTKHLVGAEALVRWNHPTKGVLSPNQFVPMLEKHNLLVILDMYVLEEVCKLYVRWKAEGKPLLPISINQSRSHLFNCNYEETLISLIDRYKVPHNLMEFELTESLFMHDTEHLSEVLASLRKQDFLVSIDDFGSGYSSLAVLKDVHIDVIKMDQGFLTGTDENEHGIKVVKHIIAMAKDLGITTVAEGVETAKQATMLEQLGCDVVQGYYFSQPLKIVHFEQLLIDDSPRCFSS